MLLAAQRLTGRIVSARVRRAADRQREPSIRRGTYPTMDGIDRVHERRRAAALARHYRDHEGLSIAEIARRLGRAPSTVKAYLHDPSYANKGHYTSLGATRAVYGAPRAESRPGPQQDRTHAAMAWRRQPDAHPARRSSGRERWWMGRERSVCRGGLNTGVHATPLEEEQPWR